MAGPSSAKARMTPTRAMHAVGDAVVDAQNERLPARGGVDDVQFPERPARLRGSTPDRHPGPVIRPGPPLPAARLGADGGRERNPGRPPAVSTARFHGNLPETPVTEGTGSRSSVARNRSRSSCPSNSITPTICIRLLGLSMRNQAVSTLDMRSGAGIADSPWLNRHHTDNSNVLRGKPGRPAPISRCRPSPPRPRAARGLAEALIEVAVDFTLQGGTEGQEEKPGAPR